MARVAAGAGGWISEAKMVRDRLMILLMALFALAAVWWPLQSRLGAQRHGATSAVAASAPAFAPDPEDPPEVALGERLFLENRFAQFFFAHGGNEDVNAPLDRGDPALAVVSTPEGSKPGPFAAGAINCRTCHMVGEMGAGRRGHRNYSDFAARSPITVRQGDPSTTTARNSPTAVEVAMHRPGLLLHFDGEFATTEDLVRETLLGRNYGWLPAERDVAMRHVARVVREDDGTSPLARAFGGPYRAVLAETGAEVPPALRLSAEFRIDVAHASDEEIVDGVARLVTAYLESLTFHRDASGRMDGSPFDTFLEKNRLPTHPLPGEPDTIYSRRLRAALARLERPRFVGPADGNFRLHDQTFEFGPLELAGLEVFLREPGGAKPAAAAGAPGTGNCMSCHPAPAFTDFGFHNTGVAESEYDAIHGVGAFQRLEIPDLALRSAHHDDWLPATAAHPRGRGVFRSVPSRSNPVATDLGVWNIVANPDHPRAQPALLAALGAGPTGAPTAALLERAIARFKTPSLRDLGQSAPYLHTGRAATIEAVLDHYVEFSTRARGGAMRNPDPRLAGILLGRDDRAALAAFLRSLNEDYE
jgi:cytochrome c peroxidase